MDSDGKKKGCFKGVHIFGQVATFEIRPSEGASGMRWPQNGEKVFRRISIDIFPQIVAM